MSPLLGLPAEGLLAVWLATLVVALAAALMLCRIALSRTPVSHAGATATSPLDRAGWHAFEAVVAAAGDQRRVFAGLPLSRFIAPATPASAAQLDQLRADFLVVGLDGAPLLVVACDPLDAVRHAALTSASVPVLELPDEVSIGDITTRVRAALGDTQTMPWQGVHRPALLSARLGSTWG